ncbi:MAG: alpha/beta hydrolase [Roseburia sp.]|nr:alpha/beta hydrolase [Ruminococcus sp.]MCM1156113.1 alpha/beta hydrolase [Roseburia sp.]MCM1242802.1 alpha/beta hydrolase [Roseburia sp.]
MKKALKGTLAALGAVGAIAAGQVAEAAYFYQRTMKRGNAKVERTTKMSGTDWSKHMDFIGARKEYLLAQPHEDVYCQSWDGLKLHATYFPGKRSGKLAICFHGYTSEGMKDYLALSGYYLKHGYAMLLPDARAHGASEGRYIGFGALDREDALKWITWAIEECGEDVQILLHGTSMGGATVLMASGLKLPEQVRGIISDCGFTSPKYVFTHVLHSMYHLPAFPVIQIADYVNRKKAGYGMDECNAAREVRKATVPILLIHGDADTFVPCSMCDEIYENCASPKKKLIVKGAAHAESYYMDTEAYEKAMDEFIEEYVS